LLSKSSLNPTAFIAFLPEIEYTLLEPEVICKSIINADSSTIVHTISPTINGTSNFDENKLNFSNLPPCFKLMTVLYLLLLLLLLL